MKKKKVFIIVGVVLILAVLIIATIIFIRRDKKPSSGEVIYVESVANITGLGYFGGNRYMGVVETQETKGVEKAEDRTVKEIYVKEGDIVKTGDELFIYDTEEMSLKLKQLELELTSIYNNISTLKSQISTLNEEKNNVDEEYKIEYTSQIQSLQAQINQENYNASAKELEIERQKTAIENAVVYSPMDGVVKAINNGTNSNNQDYYDSGNQTQYFISITDMGEYRVKANISEFDLGAFMEGDSVIIRSRVDDTMIWYGTVTKIDTENPDSGSNDYYYSGMGTSATKYPMYVALDTSDGILLGQHVYVEYNFGQSEVKEGLWLDEFYIMQEEDGDYVWIENNGKIEKRQVELGEYDGDMWTYEILSGLSTEDYIAYPEDRIKEGMSTTHNYEDVMEDDMGMYEDMGGDTDMYDDMDADMYNDIDVDSYDDMEEPNEVVGEPLGENKNVELKEAC